MMHDLTKLISGCEDFDIDISKEQLFKFDRYISLLIEWNKKINLTAIVEPEAIIIEHFLDSLSIFRDDRIKQSKSIIDVGTGAGFPGIPIKIILPNIRLVLLDSLRKRTEYLKLVKNEISFDNVEIIHSRAEDLGVNSDYREKFDLVVSRAVAPLRILCEYCLPFVRVGGFFVSYKGPAAQDELEEARTCIQKVGGSGSANIKEITVPFSHKTHQLVYIQKETKTPKRYPRSSGTAKKSPL